MNNYYVYIYFNPENNTPFYVGYGKNKRYLHHLKVAKRKSCSDPNLLKINTIRKILKSGLEPIIKFYQLNLSKVEACEIERDLILEYGRIDLNTGTLTNLTEGGDGGDTLSNHKNLKMIMENKTKKIKNSGKCYWTDGVDCVFALKPPADNYIKGYPNYRKEINKQSSLKGASRVSMKIWINNGEISKMIDKNDSIPDGWIVGRLNAFSNKRSYAKGKCHYNDGKNSYMLYPDDPKTENLVKGRLNKTTSQ
jgi:hypothetical protein